MQAPKAALRARLGPRHTATIKRIAAPLFARDLTRLGRWYGTDKSYDKPNRPAFTPIYQRHLAARRHEPLRILEIGIGGYGTGPQSGGSSLRMWRSYFRRAHVVGIDLEPRNFLEPRITTVAGDQSDRGFLEEVSATHGAFDVVIDDGSHVSANVITTFETLWPLLAPRGCYAIEDTQYSYLEEYGGGPAGTPGTSMEFVKQLCDRPNRIDDSMQALHVFHWLVLIDKR